MCCPVFVHNARVMMRYVIFMHFYKFYQDNFENKHYVFSYVCGYDVFHPVNYIWNQQSNPAVSNVK